MCLQVKNARAITLLDDGRSVRYVANALQTAENVICRP